MYDELRGYPGVEVNPSAGADAADLLFVPLVLRMGDHELTFFSTLATFGRRGPCQATSGIWTNVEYATNPPCTTRDTSTPIVSALMKTSAEVTVSHQATTCGSGWGLKSHGCSS